MVNGEGKSQKFYREGAKVRKVKRGWECGGWGMRIKKTDSCEAVRLVRFYSNLETRSYALYVTARTASQILRALGSISCSRFLA